MLKYRRCYPRFLLVMLMVLGCCVSVAAIPARAKEEQEEETSHKEIKIQMYLGQTMELSDIPSGEIVMDCEDIVTISKQQEVKAIAVGTVKISVKAKDETIPFATIHVLANERLADLTFDEHTLGAKVVGSAPVPIQISAFEGMKCHWRSRTPELAAVTEEGVLTPLRVGTAHLEVTVVDSYGGEYEFSIPVVILEPHFEREKVNVAKGTKTILKLQDASENPITFKIEDSSVASFVASSGSEIEIYGKKVGKTKVIAMLEGAEFSCLVRVTNPRIKKCYGFLRKNKKVQVKLSGLNSDSQPVWSASNSKVAVVSASGKVTALRYGSTVIQCQVDGKTLRYYLAVSTKTAVKAMRFGYSKLGKKKYSQARRMSRNYFDCSSFVYRCYRAAGKYLVRKTSWAPVAADIGKYYVRKKKKIKASGVYNESKLRPGDLICFGGSHARRNGRYKRIYHIALYIGNSRTIESSSMYNNVVIRERGPLKKRDIPVVVRP